MLDKTMLKKLLYFFFFTLLFVTSIFAQIGEVQKVDQFGNVQCEDYLARMDNLIVQTANEPNSMVYVLVYEGNASVYNNRTQKYESKLPTFGSAGAKINSMKKYLSGVKKISIDKFKFIEAGLRENSDVEIWFVPAGVEPPKPAPTLTKIKYRKGKAVGFCLYCC